MQNTVRQTLASSPVFTRLSDSNTTKTASTWALDPRQYSLLHSMMSRHMDVTASCPSRAGTSSPRQVRARAAASHLGRVQHTTFRAARQIKGSALSQQCSMATETASASSADEHEARATASCEDWGQPLVFRDPFVDGSDADSPFLSASRTSLDSQSATVYVGGAGDAWDVTETLLDPEFALDQHELAFDDASAGFPFEF